MSLPDLQRRIETRSAKIGVVGLGYVGLAVACKFAESGFSVVGLERQAKRAELINRGILPIQGKEPGMAELLCRIADEGRLVASTDSQVLRNAEVFLVAVETPVDHDSKAPKFEALESALLVLGQVIRPDTLVIIESTIAPGTMAGLVRPLLEKTSGLKVNRDFFLGHCPERVMPGKLLENMASMSRVCGGHTPETSQVMACLYRHVVQGQLDLTDCITAEMVKTTENAYRDVQIAFANEIALICEAVGADVWRVRELVNKSPDRHLHRPGAGVGGHCIPKDPWLLAHAAKGHGHTPSLIPAARFLNDGMPCHLLDLLTEALAEVDCGIPGARVAILGYAYLENSEDARNSPSQSLIERLQGLGAQVAIHDPFVPGFRRDIADVVAGADALVVMVKHDEYCRLDLNGLKPLLNHPVLIDGRNLFEPETVREAGFVFRGLGRGARAA